jgi:hypothetical protein
MSKAKMNVVEEGEKGTKAFGLRFSKGKKAGLNLSAANITSKFPGFVRLFHPSITRPTRIIKTR